MIKHEKDKWVLYSKDGKKKLGSFDTEQEAVDREEEINAIKNSALIEVSLNITKASVNDAGTMCWAATCSDTEIDKTNQATSIQLFNDWIERATTGNGLNWLPPPRTPFLGLSHYPDLDGFGEAGLTDKMYIDGNRFKAKGTFYKDEEHPLGKALFDAVKQERAMIEKGEAIEQPIRISAGWWDIAHSHGDFIFERKSLDDICPMCINGAGDKTYLKGQLDHFAATRVPINPRTSLGLEEKAMAKTRKQDAASIVNDVEIVEKLDNKAAKIGKSEADELPAGMVVKADDDKPEEKALEEKAPDVEKMEEDTVQWMPLGGATSLQEAKEWIEAQEQVEKVYSAWYLFQDVMWNILDTAEASEIKEKVTNLVKEFSSNVEAIKSSVENVYLLQSIIGGTIMADKPARQEEPEAMDLNAIVNEALEDKAMNRQQKSEVIQKAFETYAETIKARLDVVAPQDHSEEIQKAILDKLDLIATKLGNGQQVAPQAPVQKSFIPGGMPQGQTKDQLPASSVTGQPSALRAMIERSVGMQ